MRVHFIISSLGGGGAERVFTVMANSLALNPKNDISVITLLNRKESYPLDSSVKRIQLKKIKYFPSHTIRSIINLSRYYRTKSNRPDIIVSFLTLNNFITIIVAKLFSIKIIGQEHISYLGYMKGRKWIIYFTRKRLYKRADAITVLTSFDVEFYQNYGVNVHVMPNPCSFKAITDNSHKREKTILAVGSLDRYHHKGFDNLIQLIAPILHEHPDWNLKIAGSGSDGLKYLTRLAEKNNISNKIIFSGFVSNISELMNQAAIFILSSRYEGLPMVLIEAMSQGMACIAYNCKTGPSDIIEHNENGLLVQDQNIEDMQSGLRELIENTELRVRLSNKAIKSLDKYEISAITERYETLFNEIADKK